MTITISGVSLYFLGPLIMCCFFCLYRLLKGPTSSDRVAAFYLFGVLAVSLCAFATAVFQRRFLMDIALSWAILGFTATLALIKYLEGKDLDD